ncbi:MAG: hypothetical protein ACOX1Q_02355 [Eubacteriales bacterium]|jgi:hypothetical protein
MLMICCFVGSLLLSSANHNLVYEDDSLTKLELELFEKMLPVKQAYNAIESLFEISVDGEYIYPDSFGGSYIDDDCTLIVRVVDNSKSGLRLKEKINEILAESYNALLISQFCKINLNP